MLSATVFFWFILASGGPSFSSSAECECVPFYLCEEGKIAVHGNLDVIDPRFPDVCENSATLGDVCCQIPDDGAEGGEEEGGTNVPPKPGEGRSHFIEVPLRPEGATGCGLKGIDPVGRQQSGTHPRNRELTFYGEYPWMVALYIKDDNGKRFICGGSLIEPGIVITAAHCLIDPETEDYIETVLVSAGDWDTRNDFEPIISQERKVSRMIIHENFNRGNLQNDIALLFMEKDFFLNEAVDTICITGNDFKASNCQASGWGLNKYEKTGSFEAIMKKVKLPLVEFDECQNKLKTTKLGKYFNLHPGALCAGGILNTDTCKGDGGGPLVCSGVGSDNFRYSLVGIVSWGIGCGTDVPGVYTSIKYYYQWITEHALLKYSLSPLEDVFNPLTQ